MRAPISGDPRPIEVILNADDFGFSEDSVRATIECFERGALTSATIMPNMPATPMAIDYARSRPDLSFGVHLTFTGDGLERPLTDPRRIPGLVDARGAFRPMAALVRPAFLGRLPLDQIVLEMRAQIGMVIAHGVRVDHLDSHSHTHKWRAFFNGLRVVAPEFGVTRARRGQNVWLTRPLRSPTYWVGGAWHPPLPKVFTTTDEFFMPTCDADVRAMAIVMDRVHGPTLEIGVHPGTAEPWRDAERRAVQDLAPRLVAAGHRLIGWRDLGSRPGPRA